MINIPILILFGLTMMGLGLALAKDGERKNDYYSFGFSIISAVITLGLVYWAIIW